MAQTAEGASLTAQQRVDQIGNRASALREVQQLWRSVSPANLSGTIGAFVEGASAVVRARNRDAANSAAAYLTSFRGAEGVASRSGAVLPAAAPPPEVIAAKIRGAALGGILNARRAGRSIDFAGQNGLVKVIGDAATLVIAGQRDTVLAAVKDDPAARGWQRITSGSPCAFCSKLAARGPVYKTARTADFEPHGHCACTAEPVFGEISATVVDLGKRFKAVTRGKSEKDGLNAWRRELASKDTAPSIAAAGPSSVAAAVKPALSFAERLASAVKDVAALTKAPFGLGRGAARHPDFTPEMSGAVNTYTGAEYGAINNFLRKLPLPYGYTAEDVTGTIARMAEAFKASKLTSDVVVYRGMRSGRGVFGDALDGDLTGFSWTEEGFGSASALEKRAKSFVGSGKGVMLRMFVPSGTGAIEASGAQLEAELLLDRNLKTTVVADHGVGPDGIRHLDVEVSK